MDDEDEDMEGDVKAGFVPEGGVRPAEELDAEDVENTDLTSVEDVNKVSKLISGKRLREVIEVSWIVCIDDELTIRKLTNTQVIRPTCLPRVAGH